MIIFASLALSLISLAEPEEIKPIDLPMESSFENYRQLWRLSRAKENINRKSQDTDPLAEAISWGMRIEEWYRQFEVPNLRQARRPGGAPPLEAPWRYSFKSIENDFNFFKNQVDPKTKEILGKKSPFPPELPVARNVMDWYRERLRYIAANAIRWQFMLPYRPYLISQANKDVRGYIYLDREKNIREILAGWPSLTAERKKELEFALINQCRNALKDPLACVLEFKKEILDKENPLRLYDLYKVAATLNYRQFFSIDKPHSDFVLQTAGKNSLFQLLQPEHVDKADWFKDVISRYFKLEGWGLDIEYRNKEMLKNPTRVIFKPGEFAHVNEVGGNEIYLDSIGYDLEPFTAAHEFGHILGFKDCYLEFYDIGTEENVYYGLDGTDIMCAQSGSIQAKHLAELRRVYK